MRVDPTARTYLGEIVTDKMLATMQARAAMLGARLEIRPSGYHLQRGHQRATLGQWRHVCSLIGDMEHEARQGVRA